jgi:hypothetical protein
LKYQIGEKVKVIATGRTGEIKAYKHEAFHINGKIEETIKYYMFFPPYTNEWFREDQLSNTYIFDDKFELGLSKFLIDLYLKNRKFDIVKTISKNNKA